MHGRNAAQLRIDLRNECAELQLLGELAGVEIADRARLNFCGIDLGVVDRFFPGFNDQVPDGFAFLFQVALKIGAPAAENVNFVHKIGSFVISGKLSRNFHAVILCVAKGFG